MFDVSRITKFSKAEKKVTKARITVAFHLLKAIKEDRLGVIDFEWVHMFENSILGEATYSGIVPALLVLKRYARTQRDNLSLRAVLAKKLYDIKLQVGGGSPHEEFSDNVDQHGRELASFYLANTEERSGSPEMFR